jgi:general secretion pathway protein I
MSGRNARGFTMVEVLVALMIVAMGLAALMVAVSGTARTSGYLRDKTLAQWIALNRLSEVRLNTTKFGQNTDVGELTFAGRTWHYDTRYFDTSIATMKRVVVRVYAGNAKAKGNPVTESASFLGSALAPPQSNPLDWNAGTNANSNGTPGTTPPGGVNGLPGAPGTPGSPPGTSVPQTNSAPGTGPLPQR